MNSNNSRAKAYPLAFALLVMTTFALVLTPWSSAQAATIANAITEVTVTPPNGDIDNELRVDLKWCVPNGSKAGDTFTMTLPDELKVRVTGFPLNNPAGKRVANATIADKVVTFTLTDFAETHTNVCGTAWFRSWYDQDQIQANTKSTLEFTVGDQVFRQEVTPTDSTTPAGPRVFPNPTKWGDWRDEAQTRARWELESPAAPPGGWDGASPVVITDTAPEGMDFDCSTVKVRLADNWSYWPVDSSNYTVNCAANDIKVTYTGPIANEQSVFLRYDTIVSDTAAARQLEAYTNVARFAYPSVTEPVQASYTVRRRSIRNNPSKSGEWVDSSDQAAIQWTIRTPDAPAAGWDAGAKIEDTAQDGLAFRCDSLKVQLVTQGLGAETLDLADLGSCTADKLTLNYTNRLTKGQGLLVDIITDVTDRAKTAYDNTARITTGGETQEVQANRVERSDAGGDGNGDTATDGTAGTGTGNGSVEGETPAGGDTTGAGTATAPAQGAPAASAAGVPAEAANAPEVLPNTGGPQLAALLAGLALVIGGATFVVRNRKAMR